MVDHSALGATGPPFEVLVERGKVREFAKATYSSNPAYLDAPDAVSPPTFLTTILFWQDDAANPWRAVNMNQQRGLHAEQEFVFYGPPPRVGSRLVARSRISDITEKQGRRGGTLTFAVMTTEFTDENGNVVAEAKLTGVETSQPPEEPS